jgi:hypothetical protein
MLLRHLLSASVVALGFVACSPTMVADSGTPDVQTVEDVVDVPVDMGPPPPPPMLTGPCMADTDCPEGDTCLLNTDGWPGGTCTRTCGRDIDCDTGISFIAAVCRAIPGSGSVDRTCLRQCLNGFDCGRPGYTCIRPSDTATSGVCVPSCTADSCGTGARCNDWTGQCQAESEPYPPTGQENGQPCTGTATANDCRSHACVPSANAGTPSGWNGGYCYSSCAIPTGWNSTSLYAGNEFPQSNCPSGSICFPNSGDYAEQGPGDCYKECRADTDCRQAEGYFCRRTFNLIRLHPDHTTYAEPHTWDNGFCAPVDCLNDTMHPCPTGYTCATRTDSGGGMYGRCLPM